MPYSATIETQSDEIGEGWHIDSIGMSPEEFIAKARNNGGILLPFKNGMAPFIPWEEIRQIWIDDGSDPVCDHCKEEEDPHRQTADKDLTIN